MGVELMDRKQPTEVGEAITAALDTIEGVLLRIHGEKPNFGDSAMRSATYLFATVLLDKMYDLQSREEMPLDVKTDMANKLGEELRALVKRYTDIDTVTLYNGDGGSSVHNKQAT